MNRLITTRVLRSDLRCDAEVVAGINALLDPILVPPPRRRPLRATLSQLARLLSRVASRD